MPFTGKQLDGIWNTHTKGKYTAIKKMNRSSVKWLGGISTRWKKCSVVKHIRTKQTKKKPSCVSWMCVYPFGLCEKGGKGMIHSHGSCRSVPVLSRGGGHKSCLVVQHWDEFCGERPILYPDVTVSSKSESRHFEFWLMIDSIIFLPRSIFLISIWIQRDGFLFSQSNSLHFYFGTCHAGILYSFPRFLFGFKLGMAHMVF